MMNTNTTKKHFEEEILRYVNENVVTIVNSDNCGDIPFYLEQAGYKVIVTTSERKLNAYVRVNSLIQKYNDDNAKKIVFYNNISPSYYENYQIIFMSYSGKVIREILNNKDSNMVLIIEDSFNSINAQLLMVLCKHLIDSGSKIRLVIVHNLSMFNCTLSNFFYNAPIIETPIKPYWVSFCYEHDKNIAQLLLDLLQHSSHRNFLILLPGQSEINQLSNTLKECFKECHIDAEMFSMYSGISFEKFRNQCIESIKKRIILSSDIIQKVSIPIDIDVVIDSGTEKSVKNIDGVKTSFIRNISQNSIELHKELAGKYSPGVYWLCSKISYSNRKKFHNEVDPNLDNMILELINFNIDIFSHYFLSSKANYYIFASISLLKKLGAINDDLQITDIGKKMCLIPIDVRFSRTLLEAKLNDAEFETLMFYVLVRFKIPHINYINNFAYSKKSDLAGMLDILTYHYFNTDYMSYSNVISQSIAIIRKFVRILGITPRCTINLEGLKKSIPYGFPDGLYVLTLPNKYQNSSHNLYRSLHNPSVLSLSLDTYKYVVGFPSDFINKTSSKSVAKRHLLLSTVYTLEEVLEYFSPFLSKNSSEVGITKYFYNGIEIASFPSDSNLT